MAEPCKFTTPEDDRGHHNQMVMRAFIVRAIISNKVAVAVIRVCVRAGVACIKAKSS